MFKVQVLLSTYNGEKTIARQIGSILEQTDIDVHILVRDDGSTDNTVQVLEHLVERNSDKIQLIHGVNVGWRKSFLELILDAPDSEYFAFSDQDDIWFPEKLIKSVKAMETSDFDAQLVHVQSLEVDEMLHPLPSQKLKIPCPQSFEMAIVTEIFQGCSMVWNRTLMTVLRNNIPSHPEIPHDFWVGLIGYLVGSIHFISEPLFYHIRYANNSSTDGNVFRGREMRLRKVLASTYAYLNPAEDLLNSSIQINPIHKRFLERVVRSRNNFGIRMLLVLNPKFRRPSLFSTLLLKLLVILGRY